MTDNTCPKCGLVNGFPHLFESCGVPKYGLQDSMMLNMQIRCEDRARSYQRGLAQGRAERDALIGDKLKCIDSILEVRTADDAKIESMVYDILGTIGQLPKSLCFHQNGSEPQC